MTEVMKRATEAKNASFKMGTLSRQEKDSALLVTADALEQNCAAILAANALDMQAARESGTSESLLDRLLLNETRIRAMADGIRQVAALPDPIGEVISETTRPDGIILQKLRVPFGVIGMIYEARPNVTADAAALALKTGNAVLLRGSGSALHSNIAIVDVMRNALAASSIPPQAIQLLHDTSREAAREMMRLNGILDLLIPRGGAALIRDVLENATVPVIETGIGNCHIFIDESATPQMVLPIVLNAKTQRPSVCNAAEKLLIHKDWPRQHLASLLDAMDVAGVELRCDDAIRAKFPDNHKLYPLPESDYPIEYLDLILGVLEVANVDAAIEHINRYGSRHTETILTENAENAERFLSLIDAAAVGHNVSSRFTDGFEYGFGAEIGISTQKLHARGPMGLPELTTYKYLVRGAGQIRD